MPGCIKLHPAKDQMEKAMLKIHAEGNSLKLHYSYSHSINEEMSTISSKDPMCR